MREALKDLLHMLGVGYVLGPYETCRWAVTDEKAGGRTMDAEVRMDPDAGELEAEIQMMYENPSSGQPPFEQLFWLKAVPHQLDAWDIQALRIHGEDKVGSVYNWEEKCCHVMRRVSETLAHDEIPDFDAIVDQEMNARERFADQVGGGSKSPKIKPAEILNMKKGMGF
jgi:hypothetical protein